jgi:hypothetical protein
VESKLGQESFIVKTAETLTERREARKESLNDRVIEASKLVNNSNDNWIVWCDFNAESELLKKSINDAVEVKGSDAPEHKENSMLDFSDDKIKALVTKSSICGFGMNWQNCNNMIFCGLSDSYEKFYQAVRRCYRFGQTKSVDVYVIISEKEENILNNIRRKEADANNMASNMIYHTSKIMTEEIHSTVRLVDEYNADKEIIIPNWLKGDVKNAS